MSDPAISILKPGTQVIIGDNILGHIEIINISGQSCSVRYEVKWFNGLVAVKEWFYPNQVQPVFEDQYVHFGFHTR